MADKQHTPNYNIFFAILQGKMKKSPAANFTGEILYFIVTRIIEFQRIIALIELAQFPPIGKKLHKPCTAAAHFGVYDINVKLNSKVVEAVIGKPFKIAFIFGVPYLVPNVKKTLC